MVDLLSRHLKRLKTARRSAPRSSACPGRSIHRENASGTRRRSSMARKSDLRTNADCPSSRETAPSRSHFPKSVLKENRHASQQVSFPNNAEVACRLVSARREKALLTVEPTDEPDLFKKVVAHYLKTCPGSPDFT